MNERFDSSYFQKFSEIVWCKRNQKKEINRQKLNLTVLSATIRGIGRHSLGQKKHLGQHLCFYSILWRNIFLSCSRLTIQLLQPMYLVEKKKTLFASKRGFCVKSLQNSITAVKRNTREEEEEEGRADHWRPFDLDLNWRLISGIALQRPTRVGLNRFRDTRGLY